MSVISFIYTVERGQGQIYDFAGDEWEPFIETR